MLARLSTFFYPSQQRSIHFLDDQGNTPLHDAVRNFQKLDEFENFLQTVAKDAPVMAKTINDQGQLPLDLAQDLKCDEKTARKLNLILFHIIINDPLKKLSDLIDSQEILDRYHFPAESEIYKNLQIACAVANETRQAIVVTSYNQKYHSLKSEALVKDYFERLCTYSCKLALVGISFFAATKVIDLLLDNHQSECLEIWPYK